MTRNPLQAAQIGLGGLLVNQGGSITIQAPGTLNLGGGVLNVALSIMAGTTVTAGTNLIGTGLILSGSGSATAFNGNDLRTANGPSTNLTTARVTSWLQDSDGLVATATSSRRFKDNEVIAEIDPRAILGINMKYWNYKAEIAKRDDPASAGYVGPDYHVALNFSPIAEDLHEAGLWMAVVYERNKDGSLVLDDKGEPIPFAIHDVLWGYLVHMVTQWLSGRLDSVEARLDAAGL